MVDDAATTHEKARKILNSPSEPEWLTAAYQREYMRRCKCGMPSVDHDENWDTEAPFYRKMQGTDHDIVDTVCSVCGVKEFNGDQVNLPEHIESLNNGRYVNYDGKFKDEINRNNIATKLTSDAYCPRHCPKHAWQWDDDYDTRCVICNQDYTEYLQGLLDKNNIPFDRVI